MAKKDRMKERNRSKKQKDQGKAEANKTVLNH